MKPLNCLIITLVFLLSLTSCGGGEEQGDGKTTSTIILSGDEFPFDHHGGTFTVSVKAQREWSAYSDDAWLTVTYTSGTANEGKVDVIVAENVLTVAREGKVVVKSGTDRAVVTVTQSAAPEVKYSDLCPLDGYMLVWQDEFDKDGILRGDWTYQTARAGWVNNELQTYVEQKSPAGTAVAECSKGTLKINCFKEGDKVYSGRVYACRNTGWKYGYVEASIKLPKGKGTWPAFWMMPVQFTAWPDDGEIDIMEEVGYHPNYTSSSIHCKKYYHSIGTQKTKERYCAGAEGEFHKYALEWTTDYIRTYVDDKELFYFENDGKGDKQTWPFNKPFYVILNLAWGGDWGGAQGVDESALPVTMEVDYVRVFQKL